MYLTQPLHKALIEAPDKTATVCQGRRHTYREFVSRIARLAAGLKKLGLKEGDRVAILSLNSDRYAEAIYATFWAGGVINPVNIRWSPAEIIYSLDDCESTFLVVDDTFSPMITPLTEGDRRSGHLRGPYLDCYDRRSLAQRILGGTTEAVDVV